MFVYSRRHSAVTLRPSWVVSTRLVAFAVTVALAWPLLRTTPYLTSSLIIYTTATITTVLAVLMGKRHAASPLASVLRAAQIACELVVVSQIVLHTGGMRSPSFYLYLTTIISAAVSYRLVGTLLVASAATAAYCVVVWIDSGHGLSILQPNQWLGTVRQLSDEDFFTAFVRLCIFYLCAFVGGYLAERLSSNDEVLAHTTEALKEAKLETGDILKHLNSGILTIDLAGQIVYFNRAAEEILRLPGRRVRGRHFHEAFEGRYPELVSRLETVLHSQKMDTRTELTINHPDGAKTPIGLSTSVLADAEGRARGVIGIFQDLTEPKMLEEKLRAKDRLAAVGELSAAIAHEIRNPLAAISGSVEVLRDELKLEDDNRRLLNLIVKESDRLNKILTDFLMYARIRPTVAGRVSIAPVIDDVLEITKQHFQDRPVKLRTRQMDQALAVQADADHLKQILINLVFNAVEAGEGPDSAVTLIVEVPHVLPFDPRFNADRNNPAQWVSIAVHDNGSGIPEEVRHRLFEPFVSSKPSGTGLGLAITSRLVENIGGAITVESHQHRGTTMGVLLPRCADSGDTVEPEEPASQVLAAAAHS